jgi:DNA gyrase/topoisomerase IV subunit B
MQLLALIPQVIESLSIPTDKNTPVAIDVDIDATLITKLNENTVIEMQVDFDYKGVPVNIKQSAKLSDYIPAQVFTIVKAGGNWISGILNSFGLKGLGCSCCNGQQQLSMGGYTTNYSSLL